MFLFVSARFNMLHNVAEHCKLRYKNFIFC